jgi:cytochrome c peroxidase
MSRRILRKIGYSCNLLLLVSTIFYIGCKETDPSADEVALFDDTPYELDYEAILPPPISLSQDNLPTLEGVKLGRMLFYDPILSKDGSVSCSSCHVQENAFSDPRRFSVGVEGQEGRRQSMALFNLAWHLPGFFWDARSVVLRHQVLEPIQDPTEMDETMENLIAKLTASKLYRDQFIRAFGETRISEELIAKGLEQFLVTLISANSKYDRVQLGLEEYTPSELQGFKLFSTEYNRAFPDQSGGHCLHCHGGVNLDQNHHGGGLFRSNGIVGDDNITDYGLEEVTGNVRDRGLFKVPSLRNVAVSAPYMHDGRFNTLEEVLEHYNSGLHASSFLDPILEITRETGLGLDEENKRDIINFLKTLTDEEFLNNEAHSSPFEE